MRVAIACDHAGYPLKKRIVEKLMEMNQVVIDLGTDSQLPVDFPDFAEKAGRAIQSGEADRAVVVCGSGVGASIAANKLKRCTLVCVMIPILRTRGLSMTR